MAKITQPRQEARIELFLGRPISIDCDSVVPCWALDLRDELVHPAPAQSVGRGRLTVAFKTGDPDVSRSGTHAFHRFDIGV